MRTTYDFVIIGAGPAGSFAAYRLANLGSTVLLLEANKEIKRKVCGEYLCPMGVEVLVQEGFKELIVDRFPPIRGMKIVPPNQNFILTEFPEKHGIALNRELFDKGLIRLAESAGAHIEYGARVKRITKDAFGWVVNTLSGHSYKARMLIGADGRTSITARLLGLKHDIDTRTIALHCHIQNHRPNTRFGEMHLFADGSYIGIDPTGTHEVNVSLICDSIKLQGNRNPREVLNHYISTSAELMNDFGLIPDEIKVNAVTPITNRMHRFTGKQFALIGDAAGFLGPLTGEGMYNGLWMAKTLTEEIGKTMNQHLFDRQCAIEAYARKKRAFFRQKTILISAFQFIIKRPWMAHAIGGFLSKKQIRGNIFVGIIGNIYRPLEGIAKLFLS